jgi:hypothetical protein
MNDMYINSTSGPDEDWIADFEEVWVRYTSKLPARLASAVFEMLPTPRDAAFDAWHAAPEGQKLPGKLTATLFLVALLVADNLHQLDTDDVSD